MANWANGSPSASGKQKMQRKKWNLDDRTSLHNLKTQLADDGSSDLQFDLAKQLLLDEDQDINANEGSSTENYHQGIHWLLRAAQQGHEQAIALLGDCYNSGRGINDSNEGEVRICLAMSPAERAARKAARELFLCLSNGGEFITASQLENKMREIYHMDDKKKNKCLQGRSPPIAGQSNNSDLVTEANLISAAVNYSNGHLPNLNQIVCVTTPHPESLNHIPPFYRPLLHPILFLTLLYYRLVAKLSTLPELLWHYKVPMLVCIYLFFNNDKLIVINFIPTAIYILSMIVMVCATFKMLKVKHEFIDFRLWSGLFQYYGRDLSVYRENTEAQFLRNNLKPYAYFFGGLMANLMLHPLVKHELLPYSELTMIAFGLTLITAMAFVYSTKRPGDFFPVVLIFASLLVNILAKYPYEMENVMNNSWEIFDQLLPQTIHSDSDLGGIEFRLNFRAIFYILIPITLVQIGSCEKWHGVYKYLIPHCVTLSWLQIGITCSNHSTMFGLVRAGVELIGAILFLPVLGLITMLLPVLSAVETFLIDQKVKIIAFVVFSLILIIVYGYLSSSRHLNRFLLPIQVTLYSIAIFTYVVPVVEKNLKLLEDAEQIYDGLTSMRAEDLHDQPAFGLSWDTYNKYCDARSAANRIGTQLRCTFLDGERIRWDGSVKSVQLASIRNRRADMLSYVKPKLLRDFIVCLFGEKNQISCTSEENCENIRSYVEGDWKCNLNEWNTYTYSIGVKMDSGLLLKSSSEIILEANHNFENFTKTLASADKIWFAGEVNSKRSLLDATTIQLDAIGCVSCQDKGLRFEQMPKSNVKLSSLLVTIEKSIKYLLNTIFNPIITFK